MDQIKEELIKVLEGCRFKQEKKNKSWYNLGSNSINLYMLYELLEKILKIKKEKISLNESEIIGVGLEKETIEIKGSCFTVIISEKSKSTKALNQDKELIKKLFGILGEPCGKSILDCPNKKVHMLYSDNNFN